MIREANLRANLWGTDLQMSGSDLTNMTWYRDIGLKNGRQVAWRTHQTRQEIVKQWTEVYTVEMIMEPPLLTNLFFQFRPRIYSNI